MSQVKVFIRVRPVRETARTQFGIKRGNAFTEEILSVSTDDPDEPIREFMFDKVFPESSTQQDLMHDMCEPLVAHVFNGFNACVFAYGQTGAGKTHSIFGQDGDPTGDNRGVLPRTLERIFERASMRLGSGHSSMGTDDVREARDDTTFHFHASFYEVYVGQLNDLGQYYSRRHFGSRGRRMSSTGQLTDDAPPSASSSGRGSPQLVVREKDGGEVFIENLTVVPVHSLDQVMELLSLGVEKRQTSETLANSRSSRSHTIFTLSVVNRSEDIWGSLNFIDLAGSERFDRAIGGISKVSGSGSDSKKSSGRKSGRKSKSGRERERERDRERDSGRFSASSSTEEILAFDPTARHQRSEAILMTSNLNIPPAVSRSESVPSVLPPIRGSPSPLTSGQPKSSSRRRRSSRGGRRSQDRDDGDDDGYADGSGGGSTARDQRIKEHNFINRSLSALGRVVLQLHNKESHVAYRDSVLTRVLQNALGAANCHTYLLANLNPLFYDECLKTLKFAFGCREVRNMPHVNYLDVSSGQKNRLIERLEAEVLKLKKQLLEVRTSSTAEKRDLRDQIALMLSDRRNREAVRMSSPSRRDEPDDDLDGSPRATYATRRKTTRFMTESEIQKSHEAERRVYEKKVGFLRDQNKSIKDKHRRRKIEMEQLKRRHDSHGDKAKSRVTALIRRVNEMKKTIGEMQLRITIMEKEKEDEIEHRVSEMRDRYEEKITEYRSLLKTVPGTLKSMTESREKDAEAQQRMSERYKTQFARLMKRNMAERLNQVGKKEKMFEELIRRKDIEYQKLVDRHEILMKTKDAQMDSLQKEIDTLYEFATKLSATIHKMETGVYPVHVRFNMKHIKISPEDLQFIGRWDLLNHVEKKLTSLNEFIHHAEIYTSPEYRSRLKADPDVTFLSRIENQLSKRSSLSNFRKSRKRATKRLRSTRPRSSIEPSAVGRRRRGATSEAVSKAMRAATGRETTLTLSPGASPSRVFTSDVHLEDPLQWKTLYLAEKAKLRDLRIAHTACKVELEKQRRAKFRKLEMSMKAVGGGATSRKRHRGRPSKRKLPSTHERIERLARTYVGKPEAGGLQ